MEKDSHMRINRLTRNVPEYRLDEIRSVLEYHDLPVLLTAMLKYMPEENFRLMIEDLRHSIDVMLENQAIFEDGTLPGQGALKILVGKVPDQKLSPSECEKIGRIIASMEGEPRRNYVGMVNFLGAACRIHHEIKKAYIDAIRAQALGDASAKETVPDVVYRIFPKKELSAKEVKQAQEAEIERLSKLQRAGAGESETRGGRAAQAQEEAERVESQRETEQPQEVVQPQAQQTTQPQAVQPQETPETQEVQEIPQAPVKETTPAKPKKQAKPKPQFKQFVPQLAVKGYKPTFMTRTGRK